ncbi:MAG: hypothetical protein Greene041619_669 [Candidatus Peregrinibacteria bacterium Greene0416_19]|nr:MAG: hypothetical protein Greene041619_669 [Candidatus Peregrinibacteria bacterium Greene0416_19]
MNDPDLPGFHHEVDQLHLEGMMQGAERDLFDILSRVRVRSGAGKEEACRSNGPEDDPEVAECLADVPAGARALLLENLRLRTELHAARTGMDPVDAWHHVRAEQWERIASSWATHLPHETRFRVKRPDGGEEQMLTKPHIRQMLRRYLREMVQGKRAIDSVALLTFDANGLKTVNDITGSHDKGDQYLQRIAQTIFDPPEALRKILPLDVEYTPATAGGGDEFFVLIATGNRQPLADGGNFLERRERADDLLDEIVEVLEKGVFDLDVSDLLSFKGDDTAVVPMLMRANGITGEQYVQMTEEDRAQIVDAEKAKLPENPVFRASMAGGSALPLQGFLQALQIKTAERRITGEESEADLTRLLMGGMMDYADRESGRHKEELKAEWGDGNAWEKWYAELLMRTASERVQLQRINTETAKVRFKFHEKIQQPSIN